jgi:flagellar basal-body rod protein FlgC
MGLFDGLDISATGLTAQRLRMDVTAENLANAQTTRGANGQPYRRKEVILQEIPATGFGAQLSSAMGAATGATPGTGAGVGGVQVAQIAEDKTPGKLVYDPGNPDANAQGYVRMPNVDTVSEMVDLIDSSRAYEANVTAMQTAKAMFSKTLDLLR